MKLEKMHLEIPKHEHLMVHARILNLNSNTFELRNYRSLSASFLKTLRELNPKSIVVPSFTYSYTKNLNFSVNNSKSEVGRFSEEIRLICDSSLRTLDPVFSVIDVENYGWNKNPWNKEAFGDKSIWESWDKLNGIIINLDLPEIISTQIHYIEYVSQVPYRFNKNFNGNVSDSNESNMRLNYKYFVRDMSQEFHWDRSKIVSILEQNNVIFNSSWNGLPVRWFRAMDIRKILQPIMMSDPYYLLIKVN